MAKFELKFLDCFGHFNTIQCNYLNKCDEEFDEHWIGITLTTNNGKHSVSLDKSSAIKFAKTLRTEINKITESEGQNG